jgi:hypothetical protein
MTRIRCLDCFADTFQANHRIVDANIRQNQQELIGTEAANHVETTQTLAQQGTHLGKYVFAGFPSIRRAKIGKAIDGDQRQGKRGSITSGAAILVVEQQPDIALVEDPGEQVVCRHGPTVACQMAIGSQFGQGQKDTSQAAVVGEHRKGAGLAPGSGARCGLPDADGPVQNGLPCLRHLDFEAVVYGQRLTVLVFPLDRCIAKQRGRLGVAQMQGTVGREDQQRNVEAVEQYRVISDFYIIGTQVEGRQESVGY